MRTVSIEGNVYRLPNVLSTFQRQMYVHFINWKWKNITKDAGVYSNELYDAILPDEYADKFAIVYPDVVEHVKTHLSKYPFRIHEFFNHMVSSQAANINLFLPILVSDKRDEILRQLKPDLDSVAVSALDNGYQIEFSDEPYWNLNDKTKISGTDSDTAIAYYNKQNELCLWLIEHKLTEPDFTNCGGYNSKGRKAQHDCGKSFAEILENKNLCYQHDVRHFKYWEITEANQEFFSNHFHNRPCPFSGGLNQLWRNQLLGLSIEQDERQPYKQVYFSVVHHPDNTSLNHSMQEYTNLISGNDKFSVFTSKKFVEAAAKLNDQSMNKWVDWYKELYKL